MKLPTPDRLLDIARCVIAAAAVLLLNSYLDREMDAEQATEDTVLDLAAESAQLQADLKFAEVSK